MKNREKERPDLPGTILQDISTEAEDFQNKVLRPIIKMQSDLLILHLKTKLASLKIDLSEINSKKQKVVLTQLFQKNQSFKREIIGIIIGQFTLQEYETYININKEINRRINQIVLNRCLDLVVSED
jgi:nitric oxide reductase activation protein